MNSNHSFNKLCNYTSNSPVLKNLSRVCFFILFYTEFVYNFHIVFRLFDVEIPKRIFGRLHGICYVNFCGHAYDRLDFFQTDLRKVCSLFLIRMLLPSFIDACTNFKKSYSLPLFIWPNSTKIYALLFYKITLLRICCIVNKWKTENLYILLRSILLTFTFRIRFH